MKECAQMTTSHVPIIATFFTIAFSINLLSMDKDKNPLVLPSKFSKNSLGCYFSTFSSDILNRFLIYDLDSGGKENFRRTNTALSRLLCLETPQDFIFQSCLNASTKDISHLIIRTLNTYRDDIPSFKRNFIKEMSSRFIHEFEMPKDIVIQYSSKIIGLSETLKWNLICADDKYSNDFSINDIKIASRSLIVACVTRDCIMLEQCLKSISEDEFSKNLRRALHIVTQNNDIHSLRLIAASKKMNTAEKKRVLCRMSSELVQLGLFCASDKVIELIMILYKRAKNMYQLDNNQPFREENFLADWIDIPVSVKDRDLYAIVAAYYPLLVKIYENDPNRFNTCLKIIFGDNEFLKYLSVHNHSKKSLLRRINCSIM
jgi:hypothetical protein